MNEFMTTYKLPDHLRSDWLDSSNIIIVDRFFKTLLVIIMAIIGVAVGMYLKRTHLLDDYFKS